MSGPLLSVSGLRTHIETDRETVRAVDGVDFTVDPGETVCLVGESGSGKTVTCESITGLVPSPPARVVGGSITFDGVDLVGDPAAQRGVRGDRIAHVFQNPQQALDPVYTVGEQVVETIEINDLADGAAARERAIDLLRRVGIPRAGERFTDYPHEFSGGMRQRVAIAIALAAEPELLIADEPTTAVDVTVQARLLELLRGLTDEGMALLLITHDLRVVAALADRVLVMYGGTIVERGPVDALFEFPAHPYTQALFDSHAGTDVRGDHTARADLPADGCRFRGECPHAVDACAGGSQPDWYPVEAVDGSLDPVTRGADATAGSVEAADGSAEATDGDPEEVGVADPTAADAPAHAASCVHLGPDGDRSLLEPDARTVAPTRGEDDD